MENLEWLKVGFLSSCFVLRINGKRFDRIKATLYRLYRVI